MKSKILKTMSWIGEHVETVITLCVLGVGQLASYLNLRFRVDAVEKKAGQTETTVDDHIASPVLHRNPDFETGQKEIKGELIRINDKLDRILAPSLRPR